MSQHDVTALTQELKNLKLREIEVLEALERLHLTAQDDTGLPVTPRAPPDTRTPKSSDTNSFKVNDRMVITNKVLRPLNRQANKGDRTAVVVKEDKQRIDIRTSNGTSTWRAPHNLRLRHHDE
jgi:hypothetical protein